jgi:hypothetical protein
LLEGFFSNDELPLIEQYNLSIVVQNQAQIDRLLAYPNQQPMDIWLKLDCYFLEKGQLLARRIAVQIIGTGKMGHEDNTADFSAVFQCLISGEIILGEKADAVHAGIKL